MDMNSPPMNHEYLEDVADPNLARSGYIGQIQFRGEHLEPNPFELEFLKVKFKIK